MRNNPVTNDNRTDNSGRFVELAILAASVNDLPLCTICTSEVTTGDGGRSLVSRRQDLLVVRFMQELIYRRRKMRGMGGNLHSFFKWL
jgi:hypothetical protein